jgi:hypothetical protein
MSGRGSSTAGSRLRPHCSQALTATARQCAALASDWRASRRTTLRWLNGGHDARDAEFGRLLHDEIHAIAARHRLHQRHGERRFAVDEVRAHRRADARSAHALDLGAEFAAVAVEQDQRVADPRAQHLGDVGRRFGRQFERAPGFEQVSRRRASGACVGPVEKLPFISNRYCRICYPQDRVETGGIDCSEKMRNLSLEVDRSSGLLRGVRKLDSPNFDARPAGSSLDLIVVHGISLPPGSFGGPWIDRLFTNAAQRGAPLFCKHQHDASLVASARAARRRDHAVRAASRTAPGMRVHPVTKAARLAMISRSASNSREPIRSHTKTCSTRCSRPWCALCATLMPVCRRIGSSATVILRRGARPIRDPRSIGRGRAVSSQTLAPSRGHQPQSEIRCASVAAR